MSKKLISPLVRLSYPHLAKPQPGKNGGNPKYSAVGVIEAETLADATEKARLDAIKAEMVEVGRAKWPGKFDSFVKSDGFKKGLRTDTADKYPDGSMFFSARATNQPGLVYGYADPTTKKPAIVPVELIQKVFYPGAYVRMLVSVFGFETDGNRGLSFGLEGIQFVKDGERMDGRVAAEDAFEVDLNAAPASLDDLV
jgi:hypothetical protein